MLMEDSKPAGDSWKFNPDDENIVSAAPKSKSKAGDKSVTWTASEFIEREKASSWYLVLTVVSAVVSVGLYFIIHDLITSIVVALAAVIFGMSAARKPHEIDYIIDANGLTIAGRLMHYGQFKSFSLDKEGAIASILLMPIKRFSPMTVIYIDPEKEEEVINIVAERLPYDDSVVDTVDRLMRRIRF